MAGPGEEGEEVSEQEPPAQVDPSGRWTRTNDILGKGAFKTVYKGFDEQEGIEVAWNQIRMNELVSTKEDRERLFAEIRVLKQLKHKNIMSFYDSWLENKGYTVNFITELFTSGTLRQYRKRHKHMDSEVMKRWAWQILCGLVYLHGHTPPIIHRDLKCDNIFINGSEGVVKIGDLGLATMLRARTAPQSVLGTPEFMAPELYDEEYDDRVDVYSFGMCLLELATLEYPYSECRNAAQIYRKVTLGVRPKALSRVVSKELAEFVGYCIQPRADRPKSRQLLKHPYFDSIRAERCSVKLSAEALGIPVPAADGTSELADYANSAGSSSVSRTSSAAGELHTENAMLLDAVPEEDEDSSTDKPLIDTRVTAEDHIEPQAEVIPSTEEAAAPEEKLRKSQELPAQKQPGSRQPGNDQPGDDAEGLRDFKVKGRLQAEEDKLNLRLRIQQPDRAAKVVEFDFDLASDTAMSVASEMVEEMSLSHTDAHRIAHAIKEEIFNLTHRVPNAEASSVAEHYHSSDEEAAATHNRALSDAGHAEQSIVAGLEPSADLHSVAACKDSAMSVCEGASPHHLPAQSLPAATSSAMTSFATCSPPDSHLSFGSSPAGEPMLVDPPPVLSAPSVASAGPRKLPASLLPPGVPRSEGAPPRLGRTDSANQASEIESLQQALQLQGSTSNGRFLFAPPKEEDRRLPLKKLLENLQEVEYHGPASHGPAAAIHAAKSETTAASMTANGAVTPRSTGTPSAGGPGGAGKQPDFRRMSYDAACMGSPASTSGRHSDTSNPFAAAQLAQPSGCTAQVSRTSSPRQEPVSESGPAGTCMLLAKSRELAEAKEARRQAAQTSLRNMESKSLEGLGTFGVGGASRGCKQVPIKMMSWGGRSG